MDAARVGVLTGDPTLIVALGLHSPAMRFAQVAHAEDLVGYDLALIDVPNRDVDAHVAPGPVPGTPTVVLISREAPAPPGVVAVHRPCSVAEVITALGVATDRPAVTDDHLIMLDEPVDSVPTFPLFTAHRSPITAHGWQAEPTPSRPSSLPPAAPSPPTMDLVARLARELQDTTRGQEPLGTSTVVTAAIAQRLVEGLRVRHAADHVCLWTRFGLDHVVLAVVGGGEAAGDIRLLHDHPALQEARTRPDGCFYRGPEDPLLRLPGLPGARSKSFGMVVLDAAPGPVDIVTISGPAITEATLHALRELFGSIAR